MARRGGETIILIDLLRFAAAIMVMAYHFGTSYRLSPSRHAAMLLPPATVPGGAVAATWWGWVGVEIFFVISGLVIARSAEGATTEDFLRRRALRLMPAAWLCGAVTLATLVATRAFPAAQLTGEALRSLLFWPVGDQIDGAYWTLGIEIVFYAAVALTLRRANDAAAIERLAIRLGCASALFWLVMALAPIPRTWIEVRTVQLLLLPHGALFALGVMLWAIDARGATAARRGWAVLFFATSLFEIAAHAANRTAWMHLSASAAIPSAIFAAAIVLLIASPRCQRWLTRHFGVRRATILGLMTYPLYLLHQDIGAAGIAYLRGEGWRYAPACAAMCVLALGLAWLIAAHVEPRSRAAFARALDLIRLRRAPRRDTLPTASPRAG